MHPENVRWSLKNYDQTMADLKLKTKERLIELLIEAWREQRDEHDRAERLQAQLKLKEGERP